MVVYRLELLCDYGLPDGIHLKRMWTVAVPGGLES